MSRLRQHSSRAECLDPGAGGFAEELGWLGIAGLQLQDVEPGLGAVLAIEIGRRAIGPPADVADQERLLS